MEKMSWLISVDYTRWENKSWVKFNDSWWDTPQVWMIREGFCEEVTFQLGSEYPGVNHERLWKQRIRASGSISIKVLRCKGA